MKINIYMLLTLAVLLSGCVQETHQKTVTFELAVDSTLDFNTLGIKGSLKPLSWQKTTYLSGPDENGHYSTIVDFDTANNELSFNFILDDSIFELDGQNNRQLKFEYKPETLNYQGTFDKPKN